MKLLIANWKMAPQTPKGARALASATALIARAHKNELNIVVCVPLCYVSTARAASKTLQIGAQDVAANLVAASTGKVSAPMLKGVSVSHVIVGHSEVRAMGDTNDTVKQKIDSVIKAKLVPIICVGEKERDDHGWYLSTIKDQIESALAGITKAVLKRIVIAYEPVWAIGVNAARQATPNECQEMVLFIRKLLTDLYDEKTARSVPILYGGSVSEENARMFVTEGEAAGLLVGRVSLEPKRFAKIAQRIAA